MWPSNALTERLGLKWPIFQSPMSTVAGPALAAAVSNAGGLGALGMWGHSPESVERRIAGFRQMSSRAINVNFPLWEAPTLAPDATEAMRRRLAPYYEGRSLGPVPEPRGIAAGEITAEHLAVILRLKPEVVSFHFGLPDRTIVDALKGAGILVLSSATTVAEAKALEAGGVDAVIAQGVEAGGHRGAFSGVDISQQPGLLALLPQVVDAVRAPVIAAGAIADGRGAAAAFMLGASAVQLGTAFVRCDESIARDVYQAALTRADDASTLVTDQLTGRPARMIRNAIVDDLRASGLPPIAFPAQAAVTGPLAASGDAGLMALYSGQAAALSRKGSAADIVEALARETAERLRAFANTG